MNRCQPPQHVEQYLNMAVKSQLVYKTFNRILDSISQEPENIVSELALSKQLGVSRTVIKKAFAMMLDKGLIQVKERKKILKRAIQEADYIALDAEQVEGDQVIREFFVNQMKNGTIRPGVRFSVLELARESGCDRTIVREFLQKFSKFGLVEKLPRKMWGMVKIDHGYINELVEARKSIEMNAIKDLWNQEDASPVWQKLTHLSLQLSEMAESIDESQFWELDRRLYEIIVECLNNRFVVQFHSTLYYLFTLHYQWILSVGTGIAESVLWQNIELLDAVINRNYEESVHFIRSHYETAEELFLEANKMLAFP